MDEISLDHNEEHTIAPGISMTVVNATQGVTQVALYRPEFCWVYTDEEYLNGVAAVHGPFIEFREETGFVIHNVARIVCTRIGYRNAGFLIHEFDDARKCGCEF